AGPLQVGGRVEVADQDPAAVQTPGAAWHHGDAVGVDVPVPGDRRGHGAYRGQRRQERGASRRGRQRRAQQAHPRSEDDQCPRCSFHADLRDKENGHRPVPVVAEYVNRVEKVQTVRVDFGRTAICSSRSTGWATRDPRSAIPSNLARPTTRSDEAFAEHMVALLQVCPHLHAHPELVWLSKHSPGCLAHARAWLLGAFGCFSYLAPVPGQWLPSPGPGTLMCVEGE